MTIHRETLRGYLHNFPLIQAIEQKRAIDEMRKRLATALQTLHEAGASELATNEAQRKLEEYLKIRKGYDALIEMTWNVSWQTESVIRKYTTCNDDDIDRLPEYIKFD